MMKTVNSISGGKTSAFMAVNYPADIELFSLVCIEAEYCKPKDKGLVQFVSDKLGKDFIATAESDKTLIVVRDLEQLLGRKINWVVGETFEKITKRTNGYFLPNVFNRMCTTEMKMKPIFDFCQKEVGEIVEMQVGFRWDEKERGERNKDNTRFKTIIGQSENGRNKWGEIEWRKMAFPLIDNRISHYEVYQWSQNSGLDFPADSNCVGCFHKPYQQLRKNWDDEPLKMKWFADMEKKAKAQWKKETSYKNIKKIGLQQDFFFGTGSGCNGGFCTD
jgi:3'-phosphoadenosine 5'-phosphosulfate sulfotransferase (PAPS reductase)/FAD synthetase